ncbi:hypothetical protein NQ317_019797 [Molorchus minor]|uniref:C2H2-type domain-containing protein n=1 Tax=Molorchus minor TaxID=1323400 RepID=A0ABQ9JBE3_9CUCU|nr:hypothetical protein NQ317_019797 [Molorchus minor]
MTSLKDFCCICVTKHPYLENVNETDVENIKHYYKLSSCVPDQKWQEDFKICKDCVERLDSTYKFIQACLKKKFNDSVATFDCNTCKKQFKLKRSLKLHITRIHVKTKCKQNGKDKVKVETGDIKVENTQIEIVDIKLNETADIDELDEHSEDDNYTNENDITYSTDEEVKPKLKLLKRYNKRKNPLTCEYCGKVFHRRQHYSSHIRSKHTFEKPYKCDMCEARYTNSHSLLVHKRNHNNEKPFVCSYCGKSFVCSGDLYHHSKIHLNKREYKCTLCDKSFNTANPKDWKYECTYCHKRFPINSSLSTHIKRHTGVKEFSCHICEKQFFDKSELTKHLRSHSSERLFKCDMCEDRDYKNLYGLRKHMKIVHNIGTVKISKPVKKFMCPMCPKVFAFNNKLQKHICTHTGEKPFRCGYCDKQFIDSYYRKVHLKKKHNIEMNRTV